MEGTVYEGKWAEEAPKEEIVELLDGWEQEVQEMTQVRSFMAPMPYDCITECLASSVCR